MIEGSNGQIEVLDEGIVIHRRGVSASVYHKNAGELVLPFAHIAGLKFKKAGLIFAGYIHFDDGGFESIKNFNPYKDKRTVMFHGAAADQFEAVHDRVSQRLRDIKLSPPRGRPMGVADELTKLARLVDRGLLSADEYERQKSKLLSDSR